MSTDSANTLLDVKQTAVTDEYAAAAATAPAAPTHFEDGGLGGIAGGDFHAVVPVPDGSGDLAVVLGDVAGHGFEKSAQAERLCGEVVDRLKQGKSPAKALAEANAAVEPDLAFEDFGTVFAARLESETGKLIYASGGHEPALLVAPGERPEELHATGPALGVLTPERAVYREREKEMAEGGTLMVYSDGMTESRHAGSGAQHGLERLRALVVRLSRLPLAILVARLARKIIGYCSGRLSDDAALVAVRRRARGTEPRS